MIDFILRPALETDAPKIRDLIRRVGINPMDLNWHHFIVAIYNDDFIGCGQLKPHKDGSVELASLAVEEIYRGQGVARAIIEHLLSQSPRPLYLMCRAPLVPFYEKFGFQAIERDLMPPYFRRIHRVMGALVLLAGREGPYIMRVD